MIKKILLGIVVLIVVAAATVYILFRVYISPVMETMKKTTVIPYDKELTIVLGGGGNSGILVGDSDVLVIDTKMGSAADSLAAMVKQLAGNKHIFVVNTHLHEDHTGGNKFFKGQTVVAGGNYDEQFWKKNVPEGDLPTITLKGKIDLPFGNDTATVLNIAWNAHTQSDVVVYLQKRKILFCGDLVLNHKAPAMLSSFKADPEGYLKAFDFLQNRFDIKTVVPGHGDIGGPGVIDTFRTFFLDMKTAASDPAKEKELIAKYKDWTQIPFVMSPAATEATFKKQATTGK